MYTQKTIRFIDSPLPGELRVVGMIRKQMSGYGEYTETNEGLLRQDAHQMNAYLQPFSIL